MCIPIRLSATLLRLKKLCNACKFRAEHYWGTNKRGRTHPVYHPDLVPPNLDLLDQRTDDFPAFLPARPGQAGLNTLSEILQTLERQLQRAMLVALFGDVLGFGLQASQSLPSSAQTGLEFLLLQESLLISIDQPGQPRLNLLDLSPQLLLHKGRLWTRFTVKAPLVFCLKLAGVS